MPYKDPMQEALRVSNRLKIERRRQNSPNNLARERLRKLHEAAKKKGQDFVNNLVKKTGPLSFHVDLDYLARAPNNIQLIGNDTGGYNHQNWSNSLFCKRLDSLFTGCGYELWGSAEINKIKNDINDHLNKDMSLDAINRYLSDVSMHIRNTVRDLNNARCPYQLLPVSKYFHHVSLSPVCYMREDYLPMSTVNSINPGVKLHQFLRMYKDYCNQQIHLLKFREKEFLSNAECLSVVMIAAILSNYAYRDISLITQKSAVALNALNIDDEKAESAKQFLRSYGLKLLAGANQFSFEECFYFALRWFCRNKNSGTLRWSNLPRVMLPMDQLRDSFNKRGYGHLFDTMVLSNRHKKFGLAGVLDSGQISDLAGIDI